MPFTDNDLAKYPFLPQAVNYIKQLGLTIEDLTENLEEILKRAELRIKASFDVVLQIQRPLKNFDIEISSFPVAIMIVAAIDDKYLKKRYALYEAKKIYENLKQEKIGKIMDIANIFNWEIKEISSKTGTYLSLTLHFVDYLQNSTALQESEWKLINRHLDKGKVYLTKGEACRLLQEEVRKHIEKKLDVKVVLAPAKIKKKVEELKNSFAAQKGTFKLEEYPKTVDFEAFPPCIRALFNNVSSGYHLSHIGRFTLTTFLVNIGMASEKVIDFFRVLSDFNERLSRYQVEHIAGERGSRTKYIPPKCTTLQTHGVCVKPNEICERIRHPLAYYRRKQNVLRSESKK